MARLFTSESVAEGHPDKIADQISDAGLDAILEQDPKARVACETFVKTGMVLVGGEITTSAWVDIEELVRKTVCDIGYTHSDMGFDAHSCAVLNAIGKQSPDINQGVDRADPKEQGAGDAVRADRVRGWPRLRATARAADRQLLVPGRAPAVPEVPRDAALIAALT